MLSIGRTNVAAFIAGMDISTTGVPLIETLVVLFTATFQGPTRIVLTVMPVFWAMVPELLRDELGLFGGPDSQLAKRFGSVCCSA